MGNNERFPKKRSDMNDVGNDLMRKMDEFFQSKPTKNIMQSIDSFFQNSAVPAKIPVDVYEDDQEWVVKVDLPGLKKDDIDVDLIGDRITIRIDNDEEIKKFDEKYSFHHRERRYQRTERTVQLPYVVDKRTAKAKFANGVLEIRGPKKRISDHRLDIE